jgi:hypothetical protein
LNHQPAEPATSGGKRIRKNKRRRRESAASSQKSFRLSKEENVSAV